MRVITSIYLHCRPALRDDWLAGSDIDAEVEEALVLSPYSDVGDIIMILISVKNLISHRSKLYELLHIFTTFVVSQQLCHRWASRQKILLRTRIFSLENLTS